MDQSFFYRIENRIYNILTKEFKPGISYTKEHLEIFIEAIKIILPGTKLTEKEIREKLANIYVVESKQVRNVPGVDYIYYKNIVPTGGTKTNIYTIKRHKKIADIAEDHQLSEIDAKVLKNIIDKRYKNIINSNEAQELLNIEQIFAS